MNSDVITEILFFLENDYKFLITSLALVSKQWYDCVHNCATIWGNILHSTKITNSLAVHIPAHIVKLTHALHCDESITDESFKLLMKKASVSRLTKLNLDQCTKIKEETIAQLKIFTKLESLILTGCTQCSTKTYETLLTHCTKLRRLGSFEHLDIDGISKILDISEKQEIFALDNEEITDKQLKKWAPKLKSMKTLGIKNTRITNKGLECLNECKNLEVILFDCRVKKMNENLSGIDETFNGICGVGIESLAQHSPLLRVIALVNVEDVNDKTMEIVSKCCPNLEHLEVAFDPKPFTSDGLLYLAKGCTKLKSLRICSNSKIEDHSIIEVVNRCPMLEAISLYECELITDIAICEIAKRCKNLTELDLQGTQLTDHGLKIIVNHLKKLKSLHMERTKITLKSIMMVPDTVNCTTSFEFECCECCSFPFIPGEGMKTCRLCGWTDCRSMNKEFVEKYFKMINGGYTVQQARENFSKYLSIFQPTDKMDISRALTQISIQDPIPKPNKKKAMQKVDEVEKYVTMKLTELISNGNYPKFESLSMKNEKVKVLYDEVDTVIVEITHKNKIYRFFWKENSKETIMKNLLQ